MNIAQLVTYLNEKGIVPYVEGGKLKTRSDGNVVDAEVVANIKQNRDALIQFLSEDQPGSASHSIPRIPERNLPLPLSFAQQRLWFVDQLTGTSAQYNMPKVISLKGHLGMDLLQRTLNEILERHEILRTSYGTRSGEGYQVIHPPRPMPLIQIDLTSLKEDAQAEALGILQKREALAPFDLTRDLMLRFRFVKLAEDNQVLLFTMHHIASDGWSLDLLVHEFREIYRAYEAGKPNPLQPLTIQYADFAKWQRQHFHSKVLEGEFAYWRKKLAGIPQVHALPLDLPRPPMQDFNTHRYIQTFETGILEGLNTLASKQGATFFMLYQAAVALFFGRWSHSEEMVIGAPIAGRNQEVEPLIGCFVNNLIFRTDLSRNIPFLELLDQVKQTATEAYAHQTLSFDMLVEDLKPVRSMSHSPICQIVLAFQTEGGEGAALADLDLAKVGSDHQVKDLDIHLAVSHQHGLLAMQWLYSGSLFYRSTIEGMAASFETLLKSIIAMPQTPIRALPMLSPGDEKELNRRNQTQVALPANDTIHEWFENQVTAYPNRPALYFESQTLTYAELNAEANKVAHYLVEQGVKPDSLVGLCVERSLDVLVGILGILKSGAAYLPLDPNYPEERIAYMLDDSGVAIILCQTSVLQNLPVLNEKQVLPLDSEMRALLLANYPDSNIEKQALGLNADHLAYVIYTSGSTGTPKGVTITHRNVVNLAMGQRVLFDTLPAGSSWPADMVRITPESRVVQFVSFSFDAATWDWVMALLNGACLYIASEETRQFMPAFSSYLVDHRITHASLPTALLALMDIERDYALRCLVVSGDKCNERFAKRWGEKFPTYNGYGPTETTVAATLDLVEAGEVVSIGQQMANLQVYILDDHLARVPLGVIGELYIGGPGVARGYYEREELTRERFIQNPFNSDPKDRLYRTGDLVRYLADGNMQFMGRVDDQVKIRGFRVELGEIEALLAEEPEVQEVVVVVKGEESDKKIVAYLGCPDSGQDAFHKLEVIDRIRSGLKKKVPDYMIPSAFVILEKFPLNPNGKVDKTKLPEPDYSAQQEFVAPQTETELRLANIWCAVLKLERVSALANFFELGGHSLLATQVISEVADQFNKRLAVQDLFEHTTLREFANHIDAQATSALAPIRAGSGQVEAPLSFTQQRLWFLEQLEGPDALFNVPVILKLEGFLNLAALQRALDRMVARHEVLRTTFVKKAGDVFQVVNPAVPVVLEQTDFAGFGEDESEAKVRQVINLTVTRPFDLTSDLMLRCHLIRLDPETHIAVFVIHHIASDGWSKSILVHEFSTLYKAYCENKADPLPPLEIQFNDYARWQRQVLQGEYLEQELAYWKEKLTGIPQIHSLPLDKTRPVRPNPQAGRCSLTLSLETQTQLNQLALNHNASLFMVVYAAYALLIGRWSGEQDVVLGTPVAGRTQKELNPLIGFFINSLVLRTDLSGNPPFRDLLLQAKKTALEAYAHQHLPFDLLVDHLQPERSLSHAPVFQLSISFHNQEHTTLSLPDLKLSGVRNEVDLVKADIELHVRESDSGLALSWIYAQSLFHRTTMERFASSFGVLLEAIAAAPDTPIHRLPLVTEAEFRQLEAFDQTRMEFPQNLCAHQLFETQAEQRPDAIAAVFEQESITYGRLNAEANRLAHYLVDQGIRPDDMVALCLDRSLEMVIGILGILKAGAAYLPIDPGYPEERVAFMLEDSGVQLVLTQSATMEALPILGEKTILPLDPEFRRMMLASYPETQLSPAALGLTPGNLGYVIYTSGSTGTPKGVLLNHLGMVNLAYNQQHLLRMGPSSRALHFYSLSFDGATWEWLWGLSFGGALVICHNDERKSVGRLSHLLVSQFVTHAAIPPAILAYLDSSQPYHLECLVVSGEACDEATARDWSDKYRLVNSYGPSEATVCATMGDIAPHEPVTIGHALSGVQLFVLNHFLEPVPVGVTGELYVAGVGVARGYLNRDDLNQNRFIASPFHPGQKLYATGDLVCRLADGRLRFLGRVDDQVKIRGFRIEPGEIEAQINALPDVTKAAVVVQDSSHGKRLVAYVACPEAMKQEDYNEAVFVKMLRQSLKAQLPDYMIPAVMILLENLPLTSTGKLDKSALPQSQQAADKDYQAPRSEAEAALQEIWEEVLQVDRVGIHDNFFEIGGDSILSIQVVTRANQAGVPISTQNLFEAQTIAELADPKDGSEARVLSQQVVEGELKLLPVQHKFLTENTAHHHYNQSVLLRVPAGFDRAFHQSLVSLLYERHDALRLRFTSNGGRWRGVHEPFSHAMVDTSSVVEVLPNDPSAWREFVERCCNYWQESFDLAEGPLFRAVYFEPANRDSSDPGRLFLVIHHMVVDGVSWRILLPDIERAFHQHQAGQKITPLPKTSSLKEWGAALAEYSAMDDLHAEKSYWLNQYRKVIPALPQDREVENFGLVSSMRAVGIDLNTEETKALLQQSSKAYRTSINELLLAGLYLGMRQWTGEQGLRIRLEGHGRENLFKNLDVSQTVGYFTSLFPLTLWCEGMGIDAVIKSVKEQYRAIPHKGLGYGVLRYLACDEDLIAAESQNPVTVEFNYLGQFDQILNRETAFQPAREGRGRNVSSERFRWSQLGISGKVFDGCLNLALDYSEDQYNRETMEALAGFIASGIRTVISHCTTPGVGAYTPSDFPLAHVDGSQLDQWQAQFPHIQRLYPATPMQQGMYFHSLMDSTAYATQTYPVLKGRIHSEYFKRAWNEVVNRHDVFRTAFLGDAGNLYQLVVPKAQIPFHEEDWQSLSLEQQAEAFESYRHQDKVRGFQFDQPPVMRLALFRLEDERYLLLWTIHHILSDGWCLPLIYREVLTLYASYLDQQPAQLKKPAVYEDYIAWLLRRDRKAALAYWRDFLGHLEAPTPLGMDRLYDAEGNGYGEEVLLLDPDTTQTLRAFAQSQKTTVNTLVQFVWSYLLHHYSGSDDVVFGTTVSGRPAEVTGIEEMMGLFINTIPVHLSFKNSQTVKEALANAHARFQKSNEFSYLPLVEIQEQTGIPRNREMFESLLVFENYPLDKVVSSHTRRESLRIESIGKNEQSNFKLTLIGNLGQQLKITCSYQRQSFSKATILRIFEHFQRVFEQLPQKVDCEIHALALHAAVEKGQVQEVPPRENYPHASVQAAFETQAVKHPQKVAVIFEDQTLTYSELNSQANQLARHLRESGVGQESTVGLLVERAPEMIVGLLAILKAGGTYVPMDPAYPEERLQRILEDTGIQVVLTQQNFLQAYECLSEKTIVPLDPEFMDLMLAAQPDANLALESRPEQLAYIMYTSGSTGVPKGVMVSHLSVLRLVIAQTFMPLNQETVMLQAGSIAFDAATLEVWGPLLNGGCLVLYPGQMIDLPTLNNQLVQNRVNSMWLTAGLFEQWSHQLPEQSHLQWLLAGGDVVDPQAVKRVYQVLPHVTVINGYGPTENTTFSACYPIPQGLDVNRSIPLGTAIHGSQAWVFHHDGHLAVSGGVGELCVGGDGLARGYAGSPALTAARFRPSPMGRGERLYHTGDRAYQLPDGNLAFLGRLDEQVKLRGFRIELGEIVAHLETHPQVVKAVLVVRGEGAAKQLVAYLVPREWGSDPNSSPTLADALTAYCRKQLPDYMVPSTFMFLERIPLTTNGKIDRKALPEPGLAQSQPYVAPQTETEQALAAIWEEILNLTEISATANFFELGGHSLLAARVVTMVLARLDCMIHIKDVFTNATLGQLAAFIDALADSGQVPEIASQELETEEMEW